jgi:hypothetical protein
MHTRNLPTSILFEIDTPVIARSTAPPPATASTSPSAATCGSSASRQAPPRLRQARRRPRERRHLVPAPPARLGQGRRDRLPRARPRRRRGRSSSASPTAVVPDDRARGRGPGSWAEEIAANAPLAIRAMKRLYRHGLTEDFPATPTTCCSRRCSCSAPRTSSRASPASPSAATPTSGAADRDHPAGRHLVLHVPGDQLRDRRLPRPLEPAAARLRGLPGVLPPAGGRPDRAAASSCPSCASRAIPRVDASRGLPADRRRAVQEGGGADYLATGHRRPGVRHARPTRRSRCWWRSTPTPSRSTPTSAATPTSPSGGAAARVPVPAELRRALHGALASRTSGAAGT